MRLHRNRHEHQPHIELLDGVQLDFWACTSLTDVAYKMPWRLQEAQDKLNARLAPRPRKL